MTPSFLLSALPGRPKSARVCGPPGWWTCCWSAILAVHVRPHRRGSIAGTPTGGRVWEGGPPRLSALRRVWRESAPDDGGDTAAFARFVGRRATLALERA